MDPIVASKAIALGEGWVTPGALGSVFFTLTLAIMFSINIHKNFFD